MGVQGFQLDVSKTRRNIQLHILLVEIRRRRFHAAKIVLCPDVQPFPNRQLANVSVESELGTIGTTGNSIEGGTTGIIYTDPDQAKDFVEKTGIDTLAVAIGTAHGIYPSDMKPELRLDILQILKDTLDIPLVLHGGSSNKDEEIAKAVKIGISKINISSDIKVAFYDKCREVLNAHPEYREPLEIYPEPIKACREVIAHKVNLFDSADKVKYYYE